MITPLFFYPGPAGVPSTSTIPIDIGGRMARYEHSIVASGGFESMTITLVLGDIDEAQYWMEMLGAGVTVTGPDAEVIWEGRLTGVELSVNSKRFARALEKMVNRLTIAYTTVLGTPGSTTPLNNTASQARFGVKQAVVSINQSTATAAANLAAIRLAQLAWPQYTPATSIGMSDASAPLTLTLTCAGWYYALDDALTSSLTTSTAVTTTQVITLLSNYASVNAFLSTDTSRIIASGISDTQAIDSNTTYRAAIERLLSQGNGANRYAWGVYENRVFAADVWAGADPTTIDYYGVLDRGAVLAGAATGGEVLPWDVRPDTMYAEYSLASPMLSSSQVDAAARHFVERVHFSWEPSGSWSLDLEGPSTDDWSARLAYVGQQ